MAHRVFFQVNITYNNEITQHYVYAPITYRKAQVIEHFKNTLALRVSAADKGTHVVDDDTRFTYNLLQSEAYSDIAVSYIGPRIP